MHENMVWKAEKISTRMIHILITARFFDWHYLVGKNKFLTKLYSLSWVIWLKNFRCRCEQHNQRLLHVEEGFLVIPKGENQLVSLTLPVIDYPSWFCYIHILWHLRRLSFSANLGLCDRMTISILVNRLGLSQYVCRSERQTLQNPLAFLEFSQDRGLKSPPVEFTYNDIREYNYLITLINFVTLSY